MTSLNLAGRAGRWSAENWKKALFGWLVFALAAMALGSVLGHVQMPDSQMASGEAARAQTMLERADFKQPASESVLIQSDTETVRSPLFLSAVGGVVQTLELQKDVTNLRNPLVTPGAGGAISRDGHSVLVQFDDQGRPRQGQGQDQADPGRGRRHADGLPEPEGRGGRRSRARTTCSTKSFNSDFANAERMTIPITLLILLAAFGSLVAACLPVVLAFSAVLASLGLYALVTHGYSGDYQSTSAVILLIGMAVGRRLLAVLPPARARGATGGPGAASRAAAGRVDLGAGGPDLGRDGARRDGRDADRRQQDLHLDGARARCWSSSAR